MNTKEETIDVLNDLLLINNDRIAGYEKAAAEIDDSDTELDGLFQKLSNDSNNYAAQLTEQIRRLGGEAQTGTMFSGKLYRVWMDIKATLSNNVRRAVLESTELGEDAALKAYDLALNSGKLPQYEYDMVLTQMNSIHQSHRYIKQRRIKLQQEQEYAPAS